MGGGNDCNGHQSWAREGGLGHGREKWHVGQGRESRASTMGERKGHGLWARETGTGRERHAPGPWGWRVHRLRLHWARSPCCASTPRVGHTASRLPTPTIGPTPSSMGHAHTARGQAHTTHRLGPRTHHTAWGTHTTALFSQHRGRLTVRTAPAWRAEASFSRLPRHH